MKITEVESRHLTAIGIRDDVRMQINNNLVENNIKPDARGRKNYLFAAVIKQVKEAAYCIPYPARAKCMTLEAYSSLKDIVPRSLIIRSIKYSIYLRTIYQHVSSLGLKEMFSYTPNGFGMMGVIEVKRPFCDDCWKLKVTLRPTTFYQLLLFFISADRDSGRHLFNGWQKKN